MHNIYILLLLFFGSQNLLCQETLTANEIVAFKKGVQQLDKETKTIVSDFVQYKHLSFLNNDVETIGKLAFKAPNLIKWEYTAPYTYSVIFKNDNLFIDDAGDKSKIDISTNKMFKSLNDIIANSIKGNMFEDQNFDILYFKLQDYYLVKFVPKDKSMHRFISQIELKFTIKTNDVSEVKMLEPSGDYTKIVFKNKIRNSIVKDEVFSN
tara:strand:+ start:30707 stop:31333 length:627 start_codon:yes stop_codon:yes gene_type:complete